MVQASSSVGTTLSMLATTMWVSGRPWVSSALPSLVTRTTEPVSATRKLAPVMPTSAAKKRAPQLAPGLAEQRFRLVHRRPAVVLGEQGRDLVLGHVDRRRQDVARGLAGELDDVLAEIGLDPADRGGLERLVEADLLGDHGLALGHRAGAGGLAQADHDRPRLGGIAGPVDLAAGLDHPCLERLQIEIEMGKGVVLDRLGGIAQGLELGQPLSRQPPLVCEAVAGHGQRLLQTLISKRLPGVGRKLEGGGHDQAARPAAGSPIAGSVAHAGQHLGDVPDLDARTLARAAGRRC